MRLVAIHIDGFGKLVDSAIPFDPSFNVIFGDNEAGKSTLSSAILAMLYGISRGEKERWRPWTTQRFSARLTYALADGRTIEVQREFDRDAKGIRVYDGNGNDVSSEVSLGKTICPGEAHLGLPLEVFTNASFLAQGDVTIDGSRAERISHSLARALDGGPREDAALGALGRLDAAIAEHVGRKRATVNAPLRHLNDEIREADTLASEMRGKLDSLSDLRARLDTERARSSNLEAEARRMETQSHAIRAFTLRSRLNSLREVRDDLAALYAERVHFDDVDGFAARMVDQLETFYRQWQSMSVLARAQADESERGRMTPALLSEFEERNADGGALDDAAFANLQRLALAATTARDRATKSSDRAQAARRNVSGGSELFGALVTAGVFVAIAATILMSVSLRYDALACAILAAILFVSAGYRWNARRSTMRVVQEKQREADAAIASEHETASAVAAIVTPLGIASVDELARRRDRALELRARKAEAARLATVAAQTRTAAEQAGKAFDDLAMRIVDRTGSRSKDLIAARDREARKHTRDGIDLRLSMLDVRRGDLLGEDDEYALEAELSDLNRAGVEPQAPPEGSSARTFEAERNDLMRRCVASQRLLAMLEAQLETSETAIGDIAALDERSATLKARANVLENFETAIELARATIDLRTKEAHQKFARRLSNYASRAFSNVTNARYAELRIDPTTLAVRVRSPENDAIVDVDRLSAGTREQAYLVTRLAMAQMFSEGLEPAPLLLDDPFSFWDDGRIERSLPILETFVRSGNQLTIFTTSRSLADAAQHRGAKRTDLIQTTGLGK